MEKNKLESKIAVQINAILDSKKIKVFSYIVIALLFIIFGLGKFSFFHIKKTQEERISELEKIYSAWKADCKDAAKFDKLSLFIKNNSDISYRIENELIQTLLFNKDLKGNELALTALNRVENDHGYFSKFSKISILINENKLHEALTKSNELKALLEKEQKTGLTIYPYNLMRISFLAKKIKDPNCELESWNNLEAFLNEQGQIAKDFVEELEKEIKFNLVEYIQLRKEELFSS